VIVLEVPFYQVLLFEDLNKFFLIRDDREVKYGKENTVFKELVSFV
jgi:hypothetical protein